MWHPLYARRLFRNTDAPLKLRLRARLSTARWAQGRQSPRRWIHEDPQDLGACGSPASHFAPEDVLLTHWGRCVPRDASVVVLPGGVRHSLVLRRTPTRWISTDAELVKAAMRVYRDERLHKPRRRVLHFRGAAREDETSPDVADACFRPDRAEGRQQCEELYSMGVRQTVRRTSKPPKGSNPHDARLTPREIGEARVHTPLWAVGTHPMVNFVAGKIATPDYLGELEESEFCLAAPVAGFGVRIVDYAATGCLPVVVRTGQLLMPHEPSLDYDSFAVSVPFREIAQLPGILANLSDAEVRRRRERLRDVHRRFLWDEAYGTAYESIREALLTSLNIGRG